MPPPCVMHMQRHCRQVAVGSWVAAKVVAHLVWARVHETGATHSSQSRPPHLRSGPAPTMWQPLVGLLQSACGCAMVAKGGGDRAGQCMLGGCVALSRDRHTCEHLHPASCELSRHRKGMLFAVVISCARQRCANIDSRGARDWRLSLAATGFTGLPPARTGGWAASRRRAVAACASQVSGNLVPPHLHVPALVPACRMYKCAWSCERALALSCQFWSVFWTHGRAAASRTWPRWCSECVCDGSQGLGRTPRPCSAALPTSACAPARSRRGGTRRPPSCRTPPRTGSGRCVEDAAPLGRVVWWRGLRRPLPTIPRRTDAAFRL
jgi:hypothetical protein